MTILIDIGNTSIKKCKLNKGKLYYFKYIDYSKNLTNPIINFFLEDIKSDENFLICSVVPEVTKIIISKFISKNVDYKIINKNNFKNIVSPKVNMNELGSDRIINYLGLKYYYPLRKNFLVIDFGTATTIDIIVNNIYIGGVILPGLITSYKNLVNSASLINNFQIKPTKLVYGTNTKNALLSGSFNGYSHMINGYADQLQKHFKKKFKKVVTGGHGFIFSKNTKDMEFHKNLTFSGLKYYNENF